LLPSGYAGYLILKVIEQLRESILAHAGQVDKAGVVGRSALRYIGKLVGGRTFV